MAIGDYELLRGPLEQFLRLYRYQLKATEPEMRRLALAYGRMAIRTNEKLLSRYDGKKVPTPVMAQRLEAPQHITRKAAIQKIYAFRSSPII